jgi:ribosomal protein S18 acetylase RimI-like enzyme
MIALEFPYRPAVAGDAFEMAELVNMAGEGLPLYIWTEMAAADEDPWEIGQNRARREHGGFSYRNTVVREDRGKAIACLTGYPLDDVPESVNYDELPDMLVPIQQLEDLAPGTWYVNVLATYTEYRGRGFGRELLSIAENQAMDAQKRGLSIIVSDANIGARKLYESQGYLEIATRRMVKQRWVNAGKEWVLLVKYL